MLGLVGGSVVVLLIARRPGETCSAAVVAMAGIYLLAYALGRPWTVWPALAGFLGLAAGTRALIDAAELAIDRGVANAALALLVWLVAVARYRLAGGDRGLWWLQTAGMVAFGAVTLVCALVAPGWAAGLAALGFLGHAGWDAYHYRIDRVVHRTYAEACGVFDLLVGVALLVAAVARG